MINRRRAALLAVPITALALLALLLPAAWSPAHANADDPVAAMVAQVNTDTLAGYVRDLSGERNVLVDGQSVAIRTRYSDPLGISTAIQLAERYLQQHYERLGLEAELWPYGTRGWRDVIATQRGTLHPEQVYIISSHHDDRSTENYTNAPGADDNGSGTAAVMQAATILSQYQFEYTIRYINFSGEEAGLYGSYAYAVQARLRGEQILGVINLDMIAYNHYGAPIFQLHALTQASQPLAYLYRDIVTQYSLPISPTLKLGSAAMGSSDHLPFWENNYPAILGIEDYYSDFNSCYHQTCDRLSLFDLDYFTAATKAAIGTLATLAHPIQAGQPTPTATLTPAPTPTTPCVNHLPDGDFEAGPTDAPWQTATNGGYTIISTREAHSGQYAAWLTQDLGRDDSLCQTTSVPANAGDASLGFWWQVQTDERHPGDRDWLEVRVRPAGAPTFTTVRQITAESLQHLWMPARQALGDVAGQDLEVCFVAHSDYGDRSYFFVDDVEVNYCSATVPVHLPLILR